MAKNTNLYGLYRATLMSLSVLERTLDAIVLYGPDLNSHKINGYNASSTLMLMNDLGIVGQGLFTDRNKLISTFIFSNTPDKFDDPESQEIMNRMITSIKFIN